MTLRISKHRGGGEASWMDLPSDDGSVVTIGRAKANTIALQTDQSVSASHAELAYVAGSAADGVRSGWCVRDLGSSNGTALRLSAERKASRAFALSAGHRLGLGSGPKSSELIALRYRRGIAARQGRRPTMEDAHVACDALPPPSPDMAHLCQQLSFYAVYDGHQGAEASAYCKLHLHRQMMTRLAERIRRRRENGEGSSEPTAGDIAEALREAFASTDEQFLSSTNASAGTTAIAAVVTRTHCIVANCGDSRGYLYRPQSAAAADSEGGTVLRMSIDHKPDRPDETARITAAGGWVSGGRVLHTLAVSRALGDRDFKMVPARNAPSDGEQSFRMPFKAPLVSAEPEIRICAAREGDELLLACDGLWDVMTGEKAFAFLHSHGASENPQKAVSQLCAAAEEQFYSQDNITAVYVRLRTPDAAE